jgi:DNA-binding transcriptional LysR family regulator
MDTDALKAFVTVAKCGSFSVGAQQMFLTQPAISKRISKLEEQLNHRLFDRLGRDLRLTEAGNNLLPRAESILHELSRLERSIQELSGEIVGSLKVATSHHIGLHHLPPILREFASQHQNVNLQFEFLDSELAQERVLTGQCELAIVTLSPREEANLYRQVLWHDHLRVVASKNHPLSALESVSLDALSDEAAILPDTNTYTGQIIKQTFESAGLDIRLNMTTNYLETIKMMVSVGLGWSVLPTTLIDDQMQILDIKGLPALSRDLGLIRHQRRSLSNAAQAFLELVLNVTSEAEKRS